MTRAHEGPVDAYPLGRVAGGPAPTRNLPGVMLGEVLLQIPGQELRSFFLFFGLGGRKKETEGLLGAGGPSRTTRLQWEAVSDAPNSQPREVGSAARSVPASARVVVRRDLVPRT